jgi:DNA-binding MarR family transcriptional regulator
MNKIVGRNTSNARIRVARALATGAKTVPQVAALLDTTDGALRAAINGMERDGQIAKLAPPVARGQRWELTGAGRQALLEAPAAVEPGVILPGQRLLVLVDQGQGVTPEAWQALAEEAGGILWAARLDGNGALVLALDGSDPFGADRLRAQLSAAGMSSVAGRVSDTLDGRALAYGSRPAISS